MATEWLHTEAFLCRIPLMLLNGNSCNITPVYPHIFLSKSQTFFRKTSLFFLTKQKTLTLFSSSVLFFIFLLQFHLSFDDLFFVFLRLLNQKFHSLNIHFYSTCKKSDTRIQLDQYLLNNPIHHSLISFSLL